MNDWNKWPLSACAEVADLQREAGSGFCPFCRRALRRKSGAGRKPIVCFAANCREEFEATFKRAYRGVYER